MEYINTGFIEGQISILKQNIEAVKNQRIFTVNDKRTLIPYYRKKLNEMLEKKKLIEKLENNHS